MLKDWQASVVRDDDEQGSDFLSMGTEEEVKDEEGLDDMEMLADDEGPLEMLADDLLDDDSLSQNLTDGPNKKSAFDATQMYMNEIGYVSLLSAEDEVRLARLAQSGCILSRNQMIESNLRLVVKIA
ncbi:MAG TPA: sigma-70 factor domain-containing protein, partial [Candidatus Berkiella sp.]|nr:sigma-70 factor domain-containing protein [Candidatus Berkiella sp.]